MADFKHKDNQGSIFKNDKKGNDKAPDYKGTINVAGKDFSISLWVKESAKGKFFSASIQEPYNPSTSIGTAKRPFENLETKGINEENSDLPF